MRRFLRRHATALIAIAVCNFVVFFPVVFMGRALSPNDVFSSYSPWSSLRPDTTHPQNLLLNDPPTSYYTLLSLVKNDWRVFHWNPYIACGVPGFGSSQSASLTPLILLPVLLVPLTWSYTAIVFLKLNLAFLFAYLWLREEGLGRRGAAVGAIIVAAAGVYSVRWLWQITNATVFYPALLWIARRTFNRRRTSIALVALIALSFAIAGFPAAIAYGAWITFLYALFLFARTPSALRHLPSVLAAVAIAALLAFPTLLPFARFLKRSGYLDVRQKASASVYPPAHWRSFVDADRLGNPAFKNWRGDPKLGVLDNYVEATIYLGWLALILAILGLFNRRARTRWFWAAAAALILMCMFGAPFVSALIAKVPGFKYSALARTALLLPLPIGYLAAAATQRIKWPLVTGALAIVIAFQLGLVAGRFHPYLEPKDAIVPSTPTIDFLRRERGPFRIAPFFDYFWPNSAELFRLEDVRSHFSSEGDYRSLLKRLDPGVFDGRSTVLQLNSLKYNFSDPLAGMLGVRYYIEHKYIDIIKWSIFAATQPGVKNSGPIALKPNAVMQREIRVDAEPFWAIEVPCALENGSVELTLIKDNAVAWSRRFTKADVDVMNKLYVPLRGKLGEVVTLRVRSIGARGSLNGGENGFYYGRVTVPVIFEREFPDGRLFRNLTELPRFWSTTPGARVTLARYEPHEQRVVTESPAPMFLSSSEKLNEDLRVTIDGRPARPSKINLLFTGLEVPAGRHEILLSRRLARGWWWTAIIGAVSWVAVAAWELTSFVRRRRTGTRTARATPA